MHSVRALLQAKPLRLITASPLTSVAEAMRIMRQETVRSVLITHEGNLLGIVTDKDYLRKVAALGKNPEAVRVDAIMSTSLITVQIDDTLQTCMNLMADHTLHHLPVFEHGKLAGMVSWTDIMATMLGEE